MSGVRVRREVLGVEHAAIEKIEFVSGRSRFPYSRCRSEVAETAGGGLNSY
ncbi:MAG TPA: hypothetical protein VI248_13800 [Kineosporiaceae bacterium]